MPKSDPTHKLITTDSVAGIRIALLVEYSGTNYSGFQLQSNKRTVQGELESALEKLTGIFIRIHGASRTDSGAHALGQVVSFTHDTRLDTSTFVNGLNFYLPDDVKIKHAREVALDFSPRHDALSRTYKYRVLTSRTPSPLLNYRAFHFPFIIDVDSIEEASDFLIGTRDFRPFTNVPNDVTTIRRIDALAVQSTTQMLTLTVKGNAFLPKQIRRMVGILLEVGKGTTSLTSFKTICSAENGLQAGPTTPAHGLYLTNVCYADWESSEQTTLRHTATSHTMEEHMTNNQEKYEAVLC
jgi:tRNA pseudouridine38-40 synthase